MNFIPLVGAAGFEPATSWSQTRRDDRTTLRPELIDLCYCYQFDRYQTRLTILNLRGGSEITSALLQCSTLCSGSNEFKSPFTYHHT